MPNDLLPNKPRQRKPSPAKARPPQLPKPALVSAGEPSNTTDDAAIHPARQLRVLIVSHSHPNVSKGGAEIAAFQLFDSLTKLSDCQAWFLGCQHGGAAERLGTVFTQPFSAREYLYAASDFDWFKFANRDPRLPARFAELLVNLQPDVVHFHHFAQMGVECFRHVRRALPNAAIVLTLHEFLAICNHYGQMVTKGHESLCDEATFPRCNRCFPEIDPSDFFLRKRYIQSFFDEVDEFVCPSHFLADRFVAWGLPKAHTTVIRNVIAHSRARTPARVEPYEGPLRVGFFGQISRLKGIDVLFDAAESLAKEGSNDVVFDVNGDYRNQPPEYQDAFLKRLAGVGYNVRYRGPYELNQVDALMQQTDVTLVPSIWWENSPVVIQEAFRNRRPVVCSDIGGMAENVRDGLDGWHFPVGSSWSLVDLLKRLAAHRDLIQVAITTMQRPPEPEAIVATHVELYRQLAARRAHGGRVPPPEEITARPLTR